MTPRPGAADGARPWGWWLRVVDGELEDEHGRKWRSVREAFWVGRIGFPASHLVPEQLELLLRVLASIDGGFQLVAERREDLFGGDWLFWRFYMGWLHSLGMLALARSPSSANGLSDEGRSVLLMLQATREPEWIQLPFPAVLDAVRNAGRDAADHSREAALRAFESGVSRQRWLFAREAVHRSHLVTLTGLDASTRMPLRRVVWSQAFADAQVRDDFFGWLAQRVDRWEDWGGMAHRQGASALTSHFLGLFALGLAE